MPELSLFRQGRADGGIRSGLMIDGISALQQFEAGNRDDDPALLWYVDVVVEGKGLPRDPELAREWFVRHREIFQEALTTTADKLRGGFDKEQGPSQFPISTISRSGKGHKGRLIVFAVRRKNALEISKQLRELARDWDEVLQELESVGVA